MIYDLQKVFHLSGLFHVEYRLIKVRLPLFQLTFHLESSVDNLMRDGLDTDS